MRFLKSLTSSLPDFWKTIDRVAITLNLSSDQMADFMEMSSQKLFSLKDKNKSPSVTSATALSKRINVGLDDLILNQFDYKAMAQQFAGNRTFLPEKYAHFALSRRRTVIPMLDYIEQYSGWTLRALTLQRFQMTEAMFADPEQMINVRFAVDLTRHLFNHHGNASYLENMGRHSARSNLSSPLGNVLVQARTCAEIYELMTSGATGRYIEKNYLWRILSLDRDQCVLEGKPSEEVLCSPYATELFTPEVCMIRSGFISYLPKYVGQNIVSVKKSSCVANGDAVCTFHLDLESTQHPIAQQTQSSHVH